MTTKDISSLSSLLPNVHEASLGLLSTNDRGLGCLDNSLTCHSLVAVNFDAVKDDWYGKRFFHQVRSCDALYKNGDRYYLIEFKTGSPKNLDLFRKLYDSVIALVENKVQDFDGCRTRVQYLVVSRSYKPCDSHREFLEHFERGDPEPWEYDVERDVLASDDRSDIRRLSGFLVDRIYKLSPLDFEKFANNRNWSN